MNVSISWPMLMRLNGFWFAKWSKCLSRPACISASVRGGQWRLKSPLESPFRRHFTLPFAHPIIVAVIVCSCNSHTRNKTKSSPGMTSMMILICILRRNSTPKACNYAIHFINGIYVDIRRWETFSFPAEEEGCVYPT